MAFSRQGDSPPGPWFCPLVSEGCVLGGAAGSEWGGRGGEGERWAKPKFGVIEGQPAIHS